MTAQALANQEIIDESRTSDIVGHLQEHGQRYYAEFDGRDIQVRLVRQWRRENSRLYRFQLNDHEYEKFVFVKVPTLRGQLRGNERPYLIPETDPAKKLRFQFEGLRTIDEHLGQLDASRFGTVRILDLIPDKGAFVMEEVRGRPIRQWLNKAHRFRTAPRNLELAMHNAGAWLQAFHAIPASDGIETIHSRREDFIDSIREFAEFLGAKLDDARFARSVIARTTRAAERILPDSLLLGLRFGDFGLTNILVAPSGRVTPIDTMARLRAPIYEDIAWLLTALKAYKVQVATQGLAFSGDRINSLEKAFLAGYFGEEAAPRGPITLYQVLRLLERWSAKAARFEHRANHKERIAARLSNRFFRRKILTSLCSIL